MLSRLHIRNYILIDSLDIDFPEGLVIVTGQTGAGKSILLGALSLLCGGKADAGMVSQGAENCVVEAEFDTPEGHRIIRRVVNASGRSRSFIDDCPVQVQELAELGASLVDIHSQHQSLLLTDRNFQLSVLDHYAGNTDCLEKCKDCWRSLKDKQGQLDKLEKQLAQSRAEHDYNEAQYKELEAAALRSGELEELEEEQKALANAEEIKEGLLRAEMLFNPDDQNELTGTRSTLKEITKILNHLQRYLPSLEDLSQRIDSARIELDDICSEISDLASGTLVSKERLEQVEERISLLLSLLRKHGCSTLDDLIKIREQYSDALFDSSVLEAECKKLREEIDVLEREHASLCESLSNSRIQAATGFAESITRSLHFLELDRAVFQVSLESAAPGASGHDSIRFLFSSNGTEPIDIAKCASGGELSRIMLCLKAMMAHFIGMPTLIFDEIDTGVSGSVADKMGSMICEMGKEMQVFAITHLPQVAAKGKAHYVVSKRVLDDGHTVSGITKVDGEERVMELARILSGSTVTPEAIANAKALLR